MTIGWFMYRIIPTARVAEHRRTLNIMMFDLAPDAAAEYFLAKNATAAYLPRVVLASSCPS